MGKREETSYISLFEARQKSSCLNNVIECIDLAVNIAKNNNLSSLDFEKLVQSMEKRYCLEDGDYKLDLEFKEKIKPSTAALIRNPENDRHFKMETVQLKAFSREHNLDLDEATIHIGMSADEYVRNFNALALTIGKDIYFRNGAYKPESEEGRQLLAHELTHVSQNKNKEEYRSVPKKIMEQEAVLEESLEMYDPDPYEDYEVDGIKYRLRKSQIAKVEYKAEKKLEEWILDQEYKMDEQEYLKLLIKYEEYLGRK